MKLAIYSDLHLEFANFTPPELAVDAVILAGDIHVSDRGLAWALERFKNIPVIYVLGNHEYYGKLLPKLCNAMQASAKQSNVHVLENNMVIIGNTSLFGCTLWTDFQLYDNDRIARYDAGVWMTDYHKIRVNPQYSKLKPIDTQRLHFESKKWLQAALEECQTEKRVVITHHAPSGSSIPAFRKDNDLNPAYASNMEAFIEESNIDLWVHGHIHSSNDYKLGSTRVVSNPRGYIPSEPNGEFNDALVVEV